MNVVCFVWLIGAWVFCAAAASTGGRGEDVYVIIPAILGIISSIVLHNILHIPAWSLLAETESPRKRKVFRPTRLARPWRATSPRRCCAIHSG